MKRLSWKYVAGLIDGEGCIDLQLIYHKDYPGQPYIRPRLRVTMAESAKPVLDIFNTNFGGGLNKRPRKFDNPNWQDAWEWGLTGKSIRPVLQNLVNHLIIKKEQARLLIWMIDHLMGKHVPDRVRERLQEEMKAMKRDPHRLSEAAVIELEKMLDGMTPDEVKASVKNCISCGKRMRPHAKSDSHISCRKITDAIVGLTDG